MRLFESIGRWLGVLPSPDVRIRQSKDGGAEIRTAGLEHARRRCEKKGRDDAASGQHSIYSNADEPAEISRLRAAEAANAAQIRALLEEVRAAAAAESAASKLALDHADSERRDAEKDVAAAREHRSGLSEERYGFAAIPTWAAWVLAGLIFAGDVLLTFTAFSNSLDVEWYETLGLAATLAGLLFFVGVGKAYIDVVDFRGTGPDSRRPWPADYKKSLSRLLLWSTAVMLIALIVARVGILDAASFLPEEDELGEALRIPLLIVASVGALIAVGLAAVLVAVTAYLGAFVTFVSRPISKAKSDERSARRAAKEAEAVYSRAQRRAAGADAALTRADGIAAEAPSVVSSTWAQMRAAYWRGFALCRPEEQAPLKPLPTESETQ